MRIGSLFGIRIDVNASWIFVFALVAWMLANPRGPLQLEGVGTAERVALGIAGSLLFFASVLIHELAHSLLARARGIPVRGITLFIFGGVSQFEGEAQDAPGEAWISGIGPLTSLLLGVVFYGLALASGTHNHAGLMFEYLSAANIILAVFNILPAYPLDGGRVLHAVVWRITGSRRRATLVTVTAGRAIAALMIAFGIVETLTFDAFGGLWITFIGWFLLQAGSAEQSSVFIAGALKGHVAGALAAPPQQRLPADATAVRALSLMQADHVRALPVFLGDEFSGVVTYDDLARLSEDERARTYVTAVMTRPDGVLTAAAGAPANDVLAQLARSSAAGIALTAQNGAVQSLLTRESVMHWLAGMKAVAGRDD